MSLRAQDLVDQIERLAGPRECQARSAAVHELAFVAAQNTSRLAPLENAIPMLLELAMAGIRSRPDTMRVWTELALGLRAEAGHSFTH